MFRTEFNIPSSSFKIDHGSRLLTIGSCFSQVIGEKLVQNKFDTLVNPFGTIFNPVSIFKILETAFSGDQILSGSTIENNGTWFNYHIHSDLYGTTEQELNTKLETKLEEVNQYLR